MKLRLCKLTRKDHVKAKYKNDEYIRLLNKHHTKTKPLN